MDKKKRTYAVIRLSVLALIIIGVPTVLFFNYRDTLFNADWLSQLPVLLSRYRRQAAFILIALQILQVIICIVPGQPIQFAASYMLRLPQKIKLGKGTDGSPAHLSDTGDP